ARRLALAADPGDGLEHADLVGRARAAAREHESGDRLGAHSRGVRRLMFMDRMMDRAAHAGAMKSGTFRALPRAWARITRTRSAPALPSPPRASARAHRRWDRSARRRRGRARRWPARAAAAGAPS